MRSETYENTIERVKELRKLTGLSQKKFSMTYGIPSRTIESWEMGVSKPASWVIDLLEHKVKYDMDML